MTLQPGDQLGCTGAPKSQARLRWRAGSSLCLHQSLANRACEGYIPFHCGLRFSVNAAIPSF